MTLKKMSELFMDCISASPLSDETLDLVLDDLADDETLQHLSMCPYCAGRLEEIRQFDNALHKRLRRINCPTPQELSDYDMGIVDDMETNRIKAHLAECPSCQKELKMLHNFLDLLSEETALPSNIIPLRLPQWVSRATQAGTQGNLALKGATDDKETRHDVVAGNARIFLESQARPTGYILTGQVVDTENDWSGGIAQLSWEGEPQMINILDDTSEFSFELPAAPTVMLRITAKSGKVIVIDNLSF